MWQRELLTGERGTKQLAYWKKQLEEAPSDIALPYKGPRPAEPTTSGKVLRTVLSPQLSGALNALSRQSGSTLYMTIMAAFRAILSRYSGQLDFCIGIKSPLASSARGRRCDSVDTRPW